MGFWGLEVKPGKPQTYHPKQEQGKLHVTQATLGSGSGKEKGVIQCSVKDNTPVYLASLIPNQTECCPLNLEFNDEDEPLVFSVTGNRSIHLSGFLEEYEEAEEYDEEYEDDSIIGESDSESEYDSEEEMDKLDQFENFLDTNLDMYRRSATAPTSGVVIEEINSEDEKLSDEDVDNKKKKSKKKSGIDESEDEDGFPINNKKRKAEKEVVEVKDESAEKKKNNKKKKKKIATEEAVKVESKPVVETPKPKPVVETPKPKPVVETPKPKPVVETPKPKPVTSAEKKNQEKSNSSSKSQERTYSNGLVVEEVAMGKPDAKKASNGKQVSVRYIGKLQKNGKIFDSNIGQKPFKFRLGVGQVIKGWDVGVNGMRVGDKRRLTIPPAMGYGAAGAGPKIPGNSWLVFDVELIDVR